MLFQCCCLLLFFDTVTTTFHLKGIELFVVIVAYKDVGFLSTEWSLSLVMVLHCFGQISKVSLAEPEAFVDIFSLDTRFINSSG